MAHVDTALTWAVRFYAAAVAIAVIYLGMAIVMAMYKQSAPEDHGILEAVPPRQAHQEQVPPPPSVLQIPQAEAEARLNERIEAGRALQSAPVEAWDALRQLQLRAEQWRDYNRTWLDRNLGGEAAEEYRTASKHSYFGSSDKLATDHRWLYEDIEGELSKLASIRDRLPIWSPSSQSSPPTRAAGHEVPADAPIFIVHGSDTLRAEAVARTVERATGRETIILREQANLGRTLIEKFEDHAAQASYAIIILTPDDQGSRARETQTRPRARQNVIFEMGYFFGVIGRRNVSVLLHPGVEKPSDTDGIVYITFDDNGAWKNELFRELRSAKINATP